MISACGDFCIKTITKMANKIYDTGNIPNEMKKSIFIAIPKKAGTTECNMHRTLSLMSHITKIILKVVLERIKHKTIPEIAEQQYGFMKEKGTRNAIFILRMIAERAIEMQKDVYVCFIDYTKAFDKVKHKDLIDMLQQIGLDGKDLRLIRNLYWNQTAAVTINNNLTPWQEIKRGVRQGCPLSPDMFSLYSEIILRDIEGEEGIKIGGVNINNIRYADDTVLIAETEEKLQRLVDIVNASSNRKGLQLNTNKTETMVITKSTDIPTSNITIQNNVLKQVQSFV